MVAKAGVRGVVSAGALGLLVLVGGGCGLWSSESKAPAPAMAAPAPAPVPPPLREAGAQIADEAALKELVQGKTTKAEVRERFGVPQEVVMSPGIETFIYYRESASGWISRTTQRVETLTVRFDNQGVVKDFEYRFAGK